MGRMLTKQWPHLADYQIVIWFLSYVLACIIIGRGGSSFWLWNRFLAIVSIGLFVIFCLGSLAFVDSNQPEQSDFVAVGGFGTFMKASPISAWFFIGIESLNTLSRVVENPKAIVPKGQIASMITLIVTGVWIYVVCIFLPPGMPTLVDELAPLNRGYTRMFNMSNETATLLAVPATFATAQGFMLSYANIISAMANSRLFPRELAKRRKVYKTPVNSLVCGSLISFGLCFLVYYNSLNRVMYNACVIFAFVAYISQCYGYIQLKRRHGSMLRLFHSPVGVYGAVFATLIWIMNLIGIVGFQGDDEVSLSISVGLMLIFSIYYHTYAKTRQTFSEEEQKIMLVVHVAKHNNQHRHKHKRKYIGGETSSSSTSKPSRSVKSTPKMVVQPHSSVSVDG
ncbi:hypothetical protein AC1031_012829 [Aphanomyces cochlioides]|nr:hypothetical protein AC1031_012829 [Aphanomyces cochlioides]